MKMIILLISVLIVLSSTALGATEPTCGNNQCENLEIELKVGESKTITVNGVPHTFKVVGKDEFGREYMAVDGSELPKSRMEENIFWNNFQQKYGFKFSSGGVNRDSENEVFSYTFRIEEKDFCESDCIGEEGVFLLKLKEGWNLVYGDIAYYGMCDKNQPNKLCDDDILVRYMYVNPLNKYFMLKPVEEKPTQKEMDILQAIPNWDKYMENRAEWIYVKADKNLILRMSGDEDDYSQINDIKLFKGWNLVSMMPTMIDKKIEDFKGTCEIIKAVGYEPQTNSWNDLIGESLPKEAVGAGFAIRVAENCQFMIGQEGEQVSNILPPPSIPD